MTLAPSPGIRRGATDQTMSRRGRAPVRALCGALMLALTAGYSHAAEVLLAQGMPAPAAVMTLLDGSHFSLSDQKGKVVLINFWASWCTPCRAEMPELDDFYRKHKANGLQVIAISIDKADDENKVRSIMQKYLFPAAMIHEADVMGFGKISRIPLSFLIDHRGILRWDGRARQLVIEKRALDWVVLPYLPAPSIQ